MRRSSLARAAGALALVSAAALASPLPSSAAPMPAGMMQFFTRSTISIGGNSAAHFWLQNLNDGLALTGVAFTDTLPAGLVVATPNGLNSTCGGTVTAVAGSGSISLAGGTIPFGQTMGSCDIYVDVTGVSAGAKTNWTGPLTSNEAAAGNQSVADLIVVLAPTISAVFGTPSVSLGLATSLEITLTNSNQSAALYGVTFTDTLPAGLVVLAGSMSTSCGGTATAAGGSDTVTLTGTTLLPGDSCVVTLKVTAATAGTKVNSVTVTSDEGGTSSASVASLIVDDATSAPTLGPTPPPTNTGAPSGPGGQSPIAALLGLLAACGLAAAGLRRYSQAR